MFIALTNKKYKIFVKMNKFMVLYPTNLTPFCIIMNMEQCYCFDNILTLEKPTSITKFGVNFIISVF